MRNNNGTLSSTCGNTNDVIGGRKAVESRYTLVKSVAASEGAGVLDDEGAVLIDMGRDDSVVFSDEVGSVPTLATETESDGEEEEEEWESDEESLEEDEEDAELDAGLAERRRILADARALKALAGDFLRPEVGVAPAAGAVFGRNYFARPSAPAPKADEDADEEAEILADLAALKEAAVAYLHPHVGVATGGEAPETFGRSWFSRPAAPEVEGREEAEERAQALADALALKRAAADYMRPEVGVTSSDGACFGRNYFNRPSAPETEDDEFADERAEVLAEAAALKKLAVDNLHPEVGVTTAGGLACGRNYFHRSSAPEIEDVEEAEERALVLAEALALKESAAEYMHPEVGVASSDGACFGRNYFSRSSAPETEEDEFADERAEVLAEAAALKKLATGYLHPEVGVATADATAFGRDYFRRPSAPEVGDAEEDEERALVLAEALVLKESVVDYMHPEVGVASSGGACFGRNYFSRPSAPETEEDELADERAEVLAEAAALKKLAAGYLHPEVGVATADATAFGRDYFRRPSAPEVGDAEEAEERALVLAEALALKESAVDYLHPEVGVASSGGACFGRNYFSRPSAPETEEDEFADERAEVLAEAAALKTLAADYMHPEVGVTASSATARGRNYFDRPSAPRPEDAEDADERALVLAEAAALKKSAENYLHPEVGVSICDASKFSRNFFNRFSAPKVEDAVDAEERAAVLAEAAALRKSAVDFMHPEVGVTSADGACFGRNYFARPSGPETEEDELADERAEVLAEAAALKKLAGGYMHPEVGVAATDAALFGRNYFARPSAPEMEDEDAEECALVLAEAAALKKLAVDYMQPEAGVSVSDAAVFGRNYFSRYSAPEMEGVEDVEERALVLADTAALKKFATDYMHPEVGVTSADGACSGRNYFNRASALETEDDDFAEERIRVFAEAAALKKSAADYMHPEVGVITTDATAFGRNFFNRYSASDVEKQAESPEESQDVAAVQKLAAAVKGANLSNTKSTKLSSSDQDVGETKKSASTVNLFGLSTGVF